MKRASGFQLRILAVAWLPVVLFALLLSMLWVNWLNSELAEAEHKRAEAVARQLAVASEFHLFSGNREALELLTRMVVASEPGLRSVAVLDVDGLILSRAEPVAQGTGRGVGPPPQAANAVTVAIEGRALAFDALLPGEEVADPEVRLGYVRVELDHAGLDAKRVRIVWVAFGLVLLSILVGGILAAWVSRQVTGPINRIAGVVRQIGRGELDARVDVDSACVLYELETGINDMAEQVAMNQDELQRRVAEATRELREQKLAAEREARIDSLTGLFNRRAFMEKAEEEIVRASRYNGHLALVMVDLDHFKRVNDTHGHPVGDRVLIALANVLTASKREIDFLGRLGGEEFALLMPGTDVPEAVAASERMRLAIESMRVETGDLTLRCTASFGVTGYARGDLAVRDLLIRADTALYRAKSEGRNRVEWDLAMAPGAGVH